MEVYIIRHTQVAVGKDTCYGQSNVPLADTFIQDAEQFSEQLSTDFDAVYCSPLQRCKELALALKFENILFDSSLMEMNFGDWENQKWDEINQDELNHWMADFVNVKTPNGENLRELFQRVQSFFNHLRKKEHKKVLIITHAGVIRCLWAYLLDIPLQNIFKIVVGYKEIFACKLGNDTMYDSIRVVK
jgi:alpha-ribazole phosphatase